MDLSVRTVNLYTWQMFSVDRWKRWIDRLEFGYVLVFMSIELTDGIESLVVEEEKICVATETLVMK